MYVLFKVYNEGLYINYKLVENRCKAQLYML